MTTTSFADPGVRARGRGACRQLHAGPRFAGDFDMFARQTAYLRTVTSRAPAPDGYEEHDDASPRCGGARRRPEPPCPATTTCSPATSSTTARRSGSSTTSTAATTTACFELGNTVHRVRAPARRSSVGEAYYGGPPPTARPGPPVGARRVRLDALGRHPGARQPLDLDFRGWGTRAVREGRAGFTGDDFTGCWRRRPVTDSPAPRPRRGHRRRGDRHSVAYHLAQARLDRRGPARAGQLSGGRRGTRPAWSGSSAPRRAAPGWCSTPRSSTPASRRRPVWPRATAVRRRDRGAHARTGCRSCAGRPPTPRPTTWSASSDAGGGAELWPVMRVDDLVGAIWLPGDGKVNPTDLTLALAKGARLRRRADRRAGAGHRVDCRRAPAGRGSPACAPTQGDVEAEVVVNCAGQWAKAVGGAGRRHRAAALGRALLRRHRADRGRAPRPADPARPRRLDVLQGGGRRPRRRRLRAGGEAVGAPATDPVPVRVPAARGGLGPLLGAHGRRCAGCPALADTGIRKFYNGPEWFTPDNQFLMGEAPGPARLLRRRRLQLGGDRVRRWRRPRARGVDRRGEPTTDLVAVDIRRFAPYAATTAGCATGWPRSSACTTRCRGRTASSRRRATSRRSPVHDRLAAAARRSARGWAGSGRTSSRRRPRPEAYAWGKPAGSLVGRGAARHPDGRGRLRPDVVLQVRRRGPGARGGAAVGLHRRRRRAGRPVVYTAMLNRAAPTSRT